MRAHLDALVKLPAGELRRAAAAAIATSEAEHLAVVQRAARRAARPEAFVTGTSMRVDRRAALTRPPPGRWRSPPAPAARAQRGSDRDTLERLLSLERGLESAYDAAARSGALDGELAELLRDQEREHAEGLEEALAGGARAPVATGAVARS